jgi:hypothetical protein
MNWPWRFAELSRIRPGGETAKRIVAGVVDLARGAGVERVGLLTK